MSTVTRLTLVTHAITDAVQQARFPADKPLNALGLRAVEKIGRFPETDSARTIRIGPEARTRQTAAALGLDGAVEPALADLCCGSWSGATMDEVPQQQLGQWLGDPGFREHGGESIEDLLGRVRAWLATLTEPGHIVAVTHPGIVRAAVLIALAAPAASFWRIDIPPLSATTLHGRGPVWTVRSTAAPLTGQ